MKPYEIWMEGIDQTTGRRYATLMGITMAKDFKSACILWAARRVIDFPNESAYYNQELNSYWNCRLFASEEEALTGG